MKGQVPTMSWIDEALGLERPDEDDHRWYDHFFDHDENAENHWLFGSDQKTLEVWWSWLWVSFEFGVGIDLERSREPLTPWLSAWINLGFLSFGISLKRPGWRRAADRRFGAARRRFC